ncbi:a7a582e9-7896-40ff-bbce-bc1f27815be8 [Sclerotinia trifoliorum]|uniref:A7a582e9-7896-40ff-bbce-bc1f27815be8 n=1 Tax=Sclerotinia trifoliorum TaxID=28548 RepID=A0A8H2W1Q2_9HELO|nr:a7a582e9-7896-40ff-bbce-bc1f27815be8 [Sclerotinia trifoliorum]
MVSVADLVTELHCNIDEIHKTIALISDTSYHDAEITRLERERDEQLQQLKMAHETATKEAEDARLKREQEIDEEIQKEEQEVAEKRKREDEERKLRIQNALEERGKVRQEEEEKRRAEFESHHKGVEDGIDEEMERLEDALEKRMTHGQKALEDLDSARRVINRQIDEQLNIPTVLPVIQYKSRRKISLNNRKLDLSLENQKVKDIEENEQNNPVPNVEVTLDVDEHKHEDSQHDGANDADNERDLAVEPVKDFGLQRNFASAKEVVHSEQEAQIPEVEHEEVSQPAEEIHSSVAQKHIEFEELQVVKPESKLESIESEPQNQPQQDTVQHVEDISEENHETPANFGAETLPDSDNAPTAQVEENESTDANQNETDDALERDIPSVEPEIDEHHVEGIQSAETSSKHVENASKPENSPLEITKETEAFTVHDLNESPEDRAAREEIAKLNEEIRRAMEEEAAEAMIPHEEFKEEDAFPQVGSAPVVTETIDVSTVNGNFETDAKPEINKVESAQQDLDVPGNDTENKEILESEEQANNIAHDDIQTPAEGPPSVEEPSSEPKLDSDQTPEDHEPSHNETSSIHESASGTENSTVVETLPNLKEKAISPTVAVEEPTFGNEDHGNAETENEIVLEEFPTSDEERDTNQSSTETEIFHEPEFASKEPATPGESEAEAIHIPLPEPDETEAALLNEEPAQESRSLPIDQFDSDESQEKIIKPLSTEDINQELVLASIDNTGPINDETPTTTGKNIIGKETSESDILDKEVEARTDGVVPEQNLIERNEESEKDGRDAANREFNTEDSQEEVSQNILSDTGEMKSSSDETFLQSEPAPEVVQSDIDSHEAFEDHILSTDSQLVAESNDDINENALSVQEEPSVKDIDIDILTNFTTDADSDDETELPETRDIASDNNAEETEVAFEPVITLPDRMQHDQESPQEIAGSEEINTYEPSSPVSDDIAKDGNHSSGKAVDSNSEEIPQANDETVQLPGHIKHRINEPEAAMQQDEDVLKVQTNDEERVVTSEIPVPDTENKDLEMTQEKIEALTDSGIQDHIPYVEDLNTPGPEEFEGTGEATLTLDVGSPLPSPTVPQVTNDSEESTRAEDDVAQNVRDLEAVNHEEEHTEVSGSSLTQWDDEARQETSSLMPSEHDETAELVKSEQSTSENDVWIHQEDEEASKQAVDHTSLESPELHQEKDLHSNSVEDLVQDNNDQDHEISQEIDMQPESKSFGFQFENTSSVSETSALEHPVDEVFEVPNVAEQVQTEIHDESVIVKDSANGQSTDAVQVDGEIDQTKDYHAEKSGEFEHPMTTQTMIIRESIPSTSTISEVIDNESSRQENEQPAVVEDEQVNTLPKVKPTSQDIPSQSQHIQHEDPEDVRAREEVARLNAEFLKAIEEEQANESAESIIGDDDMSVDENETVKEEQEKPRRESAEDSAAREEIAILNEQVRLLNQRQSVDGPAETEGAKDEGHEVSEDSKPRKLELEQPSISLSKVHHIEHVEDRKLNAIPGSPVQQHENPKIADQSDLILNPENGIEQTIDESSQEIEYLQPDHAVHELQDPGSEDEETESHYESENEWEGSVEDEDEPLPYLETIHEELHEGVPHIGEVHKDEDEEGMPTSRFFHPHWKYEDLDDELLKEKSGSEHAALEDNSSRDLQSQDVAAKESSQNPQVNQQHAELSVLPVIDNSAGQYSESVIPEVEDLEKRPLVLEAGNSADKDISPKTLQDGLERQSENSLGVSKPRLNLPQTPMVFFSNVSDDKEVESPHFINDTDALIDDEGSKATTENIDHSNATDLPRVLEPSPILIEKSEKSEQEEPESLVQNSNLTPEAIHRGPKPLYRRSSDLSPEHEAVFSRVSKIRNSLTPSPEPHQSSNCALSPRSPSGGFPPDEHRNYLDASINSAYNGWGYSTSDEDQPQNDYGTQLNDDNGRNRSHTVDTVPSFEHYASDDGDSGPPTPPQKPQYSDPVTQQPHISQMIASELQSSEGWSLPNDDTQDSANQEQNHDEVIKPPNLQEKAEFDPFNPQEYKSPIPSPEHSSTFHVSNVHVDQEYPPTLSSNPPSLVSPEKILGSNAPSSAAIFTSQTPAQTPAQTEEKSVSQLPANVYSVPWTQIEGPYKAANQEKETASPQRSSRPVSSIFARTRSLFESAGTNDSNPAKQRPLSGMSIFNVASPSRSTPSSTPAQSRPHSLSNSSLRSANGSKRSSVYLAENAHTNGNANSNENRNGTASSNIDYDPNTDADFLPKCLDGDGRLPSPAYGLPGHRSSSSSFDKERLYGDEEDPYYMQKGGNAGSFMGLSGVTRGARVAEGEPLLRDEK